jgi:hypothetical protein
VSGWVSGVQIYNNTFYSNPAIPSAAFLANANPGSDSRLFENNIIYSAVPQMIQTPPGYALDNNIYWTTSTSSPTWQWNGATYTDFSAYQSASGQDALSYNADPMLGSVCLIRPQRALGPSKRLLVAPQTRKFEDGRFTSFSDVLRKSGKRYEALANCLSRIGLGTNLYHGFRGVRH